MAAFTSKATGNWSASGQTTWNEVGVPGDGDTVSIGAHTVTVDVNTTIGTSPNDTTTKVLDKTSATGSLIIGAGVTLTVKGNIGGVNGSVYQLNTGASLVFDASGSGGTPVYKFVNVGSSKLIVNGTSGSRCGISAVSGYTISLAGSFSQWDVTYCDFQRVAAGTVSINSAVNFTHNTTANSGNVVFSLFTTTVSVDISDNTWSSTTGTAGAFQLTHSGVKTSGTRVMARNVFDKFITHNAIGFTIVDNAFCGGITCVAGRAWELFARNFVLQDGTLNSGNGAVFPASSYRNYFIVANETGNPHFVSATATLGSDNTISQAIFEGRTPDLVDTGDCILVNAAATSGGTKIIGKNNIVLKQSYSGNNAYTGTLLTLYANATSVTRWERNTINVDDTSLGGVGKRGAFAFAEAGNGAAGQVEVLKSNIAWGSSASQGYLAERITGTVDGHITASGADYNWLHNLSAGDNGRGYEDRGNTPGQDLWSTGNADGGDAAAAGVDNHQGTGNPQFLDSARNVAAWAVARSYGSTYDDGLTAIKANPVRTADLIMYVFEGHKPTNAACRNAAHDGSCVGAANFESGRSRVRLDAITAIFDGLF